MCSEMKSVVIYTDGCCLGNPGIGGWACILKAGDHQKELSGGIEATTTNNEMELYAILKSIEALKTRCQVELFTDSKLAIDWLSGKAKVNKPEIAFLVGEIEHAIYINGHKVTFHKVKGHAEDLLNRRVDRLARAGAKQINRIDMMPVVV